MSCEVLCSECDMMNAAHLLFAYLEIRTLYEKDAPFNRQTIGVNTLQS